MAEFDIYPLDACDECVLFHANGDLPEDPDREAAILAGFERETRGPGWIALGDPDDRDFTWARCEVCNGLLGDHYSGGLNLLVPKGE